MRAYVVGILVGWAVARPAGAGASVLEARLVAVELRDLPAAEAAAAAGVTPKAVRAWRREWGGGRKAKGGKAERRKDQNQRSFLSAFPPVPLSAFSIPVQPAVRGRVYGMGEDFDLFAAGILCGWCVGGPPEQRAARERFVQLVLVERRGIKPAHRALKAAGEKVSLRTLYYWADHLRAVLVRRDELAARMGLQDGQMAHGQMARSEEGASAGELVGLGYRMVG